MADLERRGFVRKALGTAAAMMAGTESMAQQKDSSETVTISKLQFNALHFGITQYQLTLLQTAGAALEGDENSIDIRLKGRRLTLSSGDKVVRINFDEHITFTIATDKEVRKFRFEK